MKPSAISVTCVLSDNRIINFDQNEYGNLAVQVTYKDKYHLVNPLSLQNIGVQQEFVDLQPENLFSKIDRFGRQAILEALKKQPTLDSNSPVYLKVEDGELMDIRNGAVDKVLTVKNLTIIFKKSEELDRLNQSFSLFPQSQASKLV